MSVDHDTLETICLLRLAFPLDRPSRRAENGHALLSAIAELRGGQLLEERYLGHAMRHRVRCGAGHAFSSAAYGLIRGKWCVACAHDGRRLSLQLAHEEAQARGGRCLSRRYVNQRTKLEWQCAHGHRWRTILDNVRRSGTWCPACAGQPGPREMLRRIRAAAEERGGRLLTFDYVNAQSKLRFRCAKGHEWLASRASRVMHGVWCPRCAHPTPEEQYERLREVVRRHGGELLSRRYVNSTTKIHVRCHKGHEWKALSNTLFGGAWCAQCHHESRRVRKGANARRRRRDPID